MKQRIPAVSMRKAKRAARKSVRQAAAEDPAPLDPIQRSVLGRLRRIEGQIRGIQNMVANGTDCQDILVQVKAVRSALKAANGLILKRYLLSCQRRAMKSADPDEALGSLEKSISLLSNFLDN